MNITRNAIWLLGCRILGDLSNLLLFVMISRQFGPEGGGAYSYGLAVASFVFTIGCLGIGEYGLREYARMEEARRADFLAELLGMQTVMLAAAILGIGIYLLLTAPSPATLGIVASFGVYQLAAALAATLFIPAMGRQRMMGPAMFDLTGRLVAFGVTGVAIYFGHVGLPRALAAYVLAGMVLLGLALASAHRYGGALRIKISRHALTSVSGILWSFASIEIFAQLFARVGVIALTLKRSEADAGFYATGLRLTEVGLLPLSFMGLAAYPRLSLLFRADPAEFRRVASNLLSLMVLIGGTLAWGLYFVAPLLLVPLLGARYSGAEPVVRMISALALVQACEVVMGRLMLSADLQVARAAVFAVGAAVALILNIWLIDRYGINGAIYATVLACAMMVMLYGAALGRRVGGRSLARVLVLLAASVTAASCGAGLLQSQGAPYWVSASVSIVLFAVVAGLPVLGPFLKRRIADRRRCSAPIPVARQ